jgi:hypothetical protein
MQSIKTVTHLLYFQAYITLLETDYRDVTFRNNLSLVGHVNAKKMHQVAGLQDIECIIAKKFPIVKSRIPMAGRGIALPAPTPHVSLHAGILGATGSAVLATTFVPKSSRHVDASA